MYFWAFAISVGMTFVMLIALYAYFGWQTARLAMADRSMESVRQPKRSKQGSSSPPRKCTKKATILKSFHLKPLYESSAIVLESSVPEQKSQYASPLMKSGHRYPLTKLALLFDAYDINTINVRWNASGSKMAGKGFCNFLVHGHYYLHIILKNRDTGQMLPITIHRLLNSDVFFYDADGHRDIQDQHLYGANLDTPFPATRLLWDITMATSKPFNYVFNNCYTFANTIFKSALHSVKQDQLG